MLRRGVQKSPPGESSSRSEIMPRCMKSSSTPGELMWTGACCPGARPSSRSAGFASRAGAGPRELVGACRAAAAEPGLPTGGAPSAGADGGIPGGGPRLAHDEDGARPGLDPRRRAAILPGDPRLRSLQPGGARRRGKNSGRAGGTADGAPAPSAAAMGRGPGGSGGAARDAPGGRGPGGGGGPAAAAADPAAAGSRRRPPRSAPWRHPPRRARGCGDAHGDTTRGRTANLKLRQRARQLCPEPRVLGLERQRMRPQPRGFHRAQRPVALHRPRNLRGPRGASSVGAAARPPFAVPPGPSPPPVRGDGTTFLGDGCGGAPWTPPRVDFSLFSDPRSHPRPGAGASRERVEARG